MPEHVKNTSRMNGESRIASRRKVWRKVGYTVLAAVAAYGIQRVLRYALLDMD